jgi:hypothetical protein
VRVRAVVLRVVFRLLAQAHVRVDDVGRYFGRDDGAALPGECDVCAAGGKVLFVSGVGWWWRRGRGS